MRNILKTFTSSRLRERSRSKVGRKVWSPTAKLLKMFIKFFSSISKLNNYLVPIWKDTSWFSITSSAYLVGVWEQFSAKKQLKRYSNSPLLGEERGNSSTNGINWSVPIPGRTVFWLFFWYYFYLFIHPFSSFLTTDYRLYHMTSDLQTLRFKSSTPSQTVLARPNAC